MSYGPARAGHGRYSWCQVSRHRQYLERCPLLPARGGDNLMMEVATSVKVPVSSRIKILNWWAAAAAHLQKVTRGEAVGRVHVLPPSWLFKCLSREGLDPPPPLPLLMIAPRPPSLKKCIILVYIRVGYYIKCNYCTKEERKSLWGDYQFYFLWSSSFFLDT